MKSMTIHYVQALSRSIFANSCHADALSDETDGQRKCSRFDKKRFNEDLYLPRISTVHACSYSFTHTYTLEHVIRVMYYYLFANNLSVIILSITII